MTKFFADTNIFVRHILQDVPDQSKKISKYLDRAASNEIQIIVISEVLIEINYVLKKVYKFRNIDIADSLESFIAMPYLEVEKRDLWLKALKIYKQVNIDIEDVLVFLSSKKEKAQVLSFDRDFKKLEKLASK